MARPAEVADHGTFSPVVKASGGNRKALRIAAAGAAIVLALTAVVAYVGDVGGRAELAAFTSGIQVKVVEQVQPVKMPTASMDMLAQYFLKSGSKLSTQEALSAVKAWTAHPTMETAQLMGSTQAATMMLATGPPQRMSLEEGSKLCEMKDKILALFDKLLAKLGGEELSANITYGKVSKEFQDAMSSWLDSESNYRLTVEQVKEAKKGASYASNEYEKWETANRKAREDLAATLARHAEERKELEEERAVIQEILRYLGVLHDVKATEKSIAAGGRDSTVDPETGVSEVKAVTASTLKASITKLQKLVLKTKLPGATQQLAQIQKLPVYSETEEVAKVLKDMLADLSVRLSILEEVDSKSQQLVDDTHAKMVEWQAKLVKLSDDADKSKEKMMQEKLEREKLNGQKDVAQSNYNTETASYNQVIPPYEKEIYVITMIKIKIAEHCDRLAAGEESTFGQ